MRVSGGYCHLIEETSTELPVSRTDQDLDQVSRHIITRYSNNYKPFDCGGKRIRWSYARFPWTNNASFSFFGDSKLSLYPRATNLVR